MKKEILLPASIRQELGATFGIERHSLNKYLKYQSHSAKARMIRAAAIERGGLIFTRTKAPQGYRPDVETTFDHDNGVMRQMFGERVELIIKNAGSAAIIRIDGSTVGTFAELTTANWADALYSLQQIYNRINH